jgi:hypothetical protein
MAPYSATHKHVGQAVINPMNAINGTTSQLPYNNPEESPLVDEPVLIAGSDWCTDDVENDCDHSKV